MTAPNASPATISISDSHKVSALLVRPSPVIACFVFAHGAGAGMRHPWMEAFSRELGTLGIASLRFQFPYMELGSRRPDPPALCHATVRAAVDEAARLMPGVPLVAGGRSFGGRMTSQAQAKRPLPGVQGLVFLSFPLHPAGRPSGERAEHLSDVAIPMLFLQGTRDDLAHLPLLQPLIERLGGRATLQLIADADHSFHAPVRSGHSDQQILVELAQAFAAWLQPLIMAGTA